VDRLEVLDEVFDEDFEGAVDERGATRRTEFELMTEP
jgi:hypothetical protein